MAEREEVRAAACTETDRHIESETERHIERFGEGSASERKDQQRERGDARQRPANRERRSGRETEQFGEHNASESKIGREREREITDARRARKKTDREVRRGQNERK
ncbi:MAG TPA: hypothetical protein V6C97_21940 [Oculatellaceae cyanobacterium]